MKQLTCEMCGGNDLVKQDGVFVCQHCGTKYSVEEAKKLMIEGPVEIKGDVKVSGVAANLTKAKRAFEQLELGDIDKAERAYEAILEDDNDNFLAYLGMASIENTRQVSDKKIMHYLEKAMRLSYQASDEEKEFIKQILDYISVETARNNGGIPILVSAVANDNYDVVKFLLDNGANPNIKTTQGRKSTPLFFAGFMSATKPNSVRIGELLINYGAKTDVVTADGFGVAGNGGRGYGNGVHASAEFVELIKKYNPDYGTKNGSSSDSADSGKKGGCYVATAVYGSYDCPEVWTLRRFRDDTLAGTWYGRAFIHTYYAISPTLVKWFGHTEWFKKMWQSKLDSMVAKLQANGVACTPYEDKNW